MFDLPIISNNNWICTLSNHSNSLVCSRCLRPLGDFQSDLFNTLSLQIEDKLINEPFKSNLLHTLESDVFHPQQKRVINKNEGPVRPLLMRVEKSHFSICCENKHYLPAMNSWERSCFCLISKNKVHVSTMREGMTRINICHFNWTAKVEGIRLTVKLSLVHPWRTHK